MRPRPTASSVGSIRVKGWLWPAAGACDEGEAMALTLHVCPGDVGTIVWVNGDVDFNTADAFQDMLLRVMRRHSPWLLVDLSGVSFMDCAGRSGTTWMCDVSRRHPAHLGPARPGGGRRAVRRLGPVPPRGSPCRPADAGHDRAAARRGGPQSAPSPGARAGLSPRHTLGSTNGTRLKPNGPGLPPRHRSGRQWPGRCAAGPGSGAGSGRCSRSPRRARC